MVYKFDLFEVFSANKLSILVLIPSYLIGLFISDLRPDLLENFPFKIDLSRSFFLRSSSVILGRILTFKVFLMPPAVMPKFSVLIVS